eukprot:7774598-Prorocentrum_lima.AAC.1
MKWLRQDSDLQSPDPGKTRQGLPSSTSNSVAASYSVTVSPTSPGRFCVSEDDCNNVECDR